MARAREDEAERERGDRRHLERRVEVGDDGHEQLEHLVAARAGVGEAEAEERSHLDVRRVLSLDVLGKEGEGGVALVAHAAVEDADG